MEIKEKIIGQVIITLLWIGFTFFLLDLRPEDKEFQIMLCIIGFTFNTFKVWED